jgi:hypothetical protein
MAWWLVLSLVAVFLHPVLLANILTFVVSVVLAPKGILFSVKRVSLFSLTFSGISVQVKSKSQCLEVQVGGVSLFVQFRKAIASWFEERPLRLSISSPHVTVTVLKSDVC